MEEESMGIVVVAEAAAAAAEMEKMGRGVVSIAERRAARCGFNCTPPPRVNTARFRCGSPLSSPAVARSPYLTIPPGLSPAALLDSPVLLPGDSHVGIGCLIQILRDILKNIPAQIQPSPTTGTLSDNGSLIANWVNTNIDKERSVCADSSLIFSPQEDSMSVLCQQSAENQISSILAEHLRFADINHQTSAVVQLQMDPDDRISFPVQDIRGQAGGLWNDIDCPNDSKVEERFAGNGACHNGDQMNELAEKLDVGDLGSQQLLEEEADVSSAMGSGRQSEDGYNWRKYGQKHVKGCEFPRSYYKCTHPSCQVKKKVERSHDGQITDTIYKGNHNHPKPQPTRRSAFGSSYLFNEVPDTALGSGLHMKDGGTVSTCSQQGCKDVNDRDMRADGVERTSSASIVTELSEHLSIAQGMQSNLLEMADNPDHLSTLASHIEDEDCATQGSMSNGAGGEDDETESKRRKTENSACSVREPRVVVQTDSEIDILDDGYRWRKYGQKVVKGNPNPRSYYKCTNPGCSVRKHVERASHDLKSVITTYEGKHNHEVPVSRNICHTSSTSNMHHSSGGESSMRLLVNNHKPEPPQGLPHFDIKLEVGNAYVSTRNSGNFLGSSNAGAAFGYRMKLPDLQPMSLSSFGLTTNHREAYQARPTTELIEDMNTTMPPGFIRHRTPMAGFNLSQGRTISSELQIIAWAAASR